MNAARIKAAIELMKNAKNLDMRTFQRRAIESGYASTVDELHACGNSACFAGYLAVSEEFKAAGGKRDAGGAPVYGKDEDGDPLSDDYAVAAYLGIDKGIAK